MDLNLHFYISLPIIMTSITYITQKLYLLTSQRKNLIDFCRHYLRFFGNRKRRIFFFYCCCSLQLLKFSPYQQESVLLLGGPYWLFQLYVELLWEFPEIKFKATNINTPISNQFRDILYVNMNIFLN